MNTKGPTLVLDLFAGPGGWSEACCMLKLKELGLEWDAAACATRLAAKHRTMQVDIAAMPTKSFEGHVVGLIASPPCQAFSAAGKRLGLEDPRGQLVYEVMRWAKALIPEWIACEQVPGVLSIFEGFAVELESLGYSVRTGILNAADYGAPQTRRRAVLMASRTKRVNLPAPSHTNNPAPVLFDERLPYVTMGEALSRSDGAQLSPGRWAETGGNRRRYELDEPAPTVAFGHDSASWLWYSPSGSTRLSVAEAGVLQGFRADYPWQGAMTKQYQQAGNAIPVPLAHAVLAQLVD